MGTKTGIEWCDHTFNPWTGCQKVSPACDHCYAETQAKRAPRTFGGWGPGAERKRTSESYWRQPLLWNKRAAKEGVRPRVFCASMADVFDNAVPAEWRRDLWHLIDATPHLDWLLLTKRPQNIKGMLPLATWNDGGHHAPNIWLGTTVENQTEADRRIPHLLAAPAAKRFLSMEPLLGPVDLREIVLRRDGERPNELSHRLGDWIAPLRGALRDSPRIDWIIAGGESGAHARPSHPDWFRSLRDQCQAAGVPFFFKQWGEWGPSDPEHRAEPHAIADDGTLYRMADLAYPDGARRGDAIRAGHDKARLSTTYRVGKKAAGALLDGREWREVPA